MELMVLVLSVTSCLTGMECIDVDNHIDASANITHPDRDMYVIHATVYQVGILTNRTGNTTANFNSTGNQESVTLYQSNGTNVDLSGIPEPLLTNVTAQTLVGVAPVSDTYGQTGVARALSAFDQLTYPALYPLGNDSVPVANDEKPQTRTKNKRSHDNFFFRLFKRDTTDNTPVQEMNGAALIPPEVGVQSISLPPLLSFNNNITDIPLPIPNTSVVHYATVNTLFQKP